MPCPRRSWRSRSRRCRSPDTPPSPTRHRAFERWIDADERDAFRFGGAAGDGLRLHPRRGADDVRRILQAREQRAGSGTVERELRREVLPEVGALDLDMTSEVARRVVDNL